MVMRLPVPVGPLQPGGHHDPGALPPARLAAVHPLAVVAGPGPPGPLLHVDQGGVVGLLEDLPDPGLPSAPPSLRLAITRQHRPPGVLPERGMPHANALVMAHRR